jgi:adenylylsulfate kinase-like enzyme
MRRAIWITGVPASGKSVLGTQLVTTMKRELGTPCGLIDANVVRKQFWPHIGLSPEDRVVNVHGMAGLAGVLLRAGSDVVIACIAPDRKIRNQALGLIRVAAQHVAVYQVHVMAPLDLLKARDDKGLYRAFEEGKLTGLTGVDAPYEPPTPEEALYIDTSKRTASEAAQEVLAYIRTAESHPWPATNGELAAHRSVAAMA